ncbi:MAG: DUF1549 and DUF1553 domain-containing protein [Gemmataceae bacterium]|jgi:hypothetical protein|nr:DUF1549 and DUF1553 domain-containing protein [Gemmataceae bacterium]
MKRIILSLLSLFFCLPVMAQSAPEKAPTGKVVKLTAHPETIEFSNVFAYRQVLITGTLDSGEKFDATRLVTWQAPKFVKLSSGLVRPTENGSGVIEVKLGELSAKIAVKVSQIEKEQPISFIRDVNPAMSKLGCNQGTCHGSAEGKNGFKLSLRGYDPIFDHRSLTDDLEGRRFNRAAPERSLMLMKPSGAVPHAGGVLWNPNDPYYEIVKQWIAQGAKNDLDSPRVKSIEVFPKNPIIKDIGSKQQFVVMATYTDGSTRDVTAESFIESSNTEICTIDKSCLATTLRRGEATMLARYEGAYDASTIIVMGDRSGFVWNNPPAFNHIDELVYEKLKRVKVLPSELTTDAEFIRRVYLDLTGLPPSAEIVRKFLEDKRDTRIKRDEVIDKLVGSEDYIEHWTNKWADMLQVNRKFLGDIGAKALRDYIRKSVAENKPYDKFAYEILTGSGSNAENPAAAYYKILRTPDLAMENTTHLFLAIRFNCNKCHDHPFEKWTQDQYYSLASYFAQIQRSEDPKYRGQRIGGSAVEGAVPLVEVITDANGGEVKHDRTGEIAKPAFPYPIEKPIITEKRSRRDQLAQWITAKENPYFAKSYVNRVWSYLTGVGIIEPVDDIRAGNPPTNPELLDRLTKDFIDSGFDVQKLIKTICKSRTYQLSVVTNKWNEGDDINYSHAIARRLPAEVLFDTIYAVTGSKSNIPGLPPGARAAQVLDGSVNVPSGFLDLFGKPVRESACECERSNSLQLGPILNLVNGPIVGEALRDPNNLIAKYAATYKDDRRFIEELYLAVLNRMPSEREYRIALQALKDGEADYEAALKSYEARLQKFRDYEKALDAKQADWENGIRKLTTNWTPLTVTKATSTQKVNLVIDKSGTVVTPTGPNPAKEVYSLTLSTKLKNLTAIRIDTIAENGKGPGRAENGNFVLSEVTAQYMGKSAPLKNAQASFAQEGFPPQNAIDNNPNTGWALFPQVGKTQSWAAEIQGVSLAIPNFTEAFAKSGFLGLGQELARFAQSEITLNLILSMQYGGQHTIGKFQVLGTSDKNPKLTEATPATIRALIAIEPSKRTAEQKAELTRYYRSKDAEYLRLQAEVGPHPGNDKRITGAQDLVWALINNPSFLFNR